MQLSSDSALLSWQDIDEFEFYPGTGADDVMEKNIVNAPLIPLWKYSGGGREARTAPGGGARAGTNQRSLLVADALRRSSLCPCPLDRS